MILTCLKIFLARIVDVSLGTIRTVLVVKGKSITPAVVAFFEVLIWFVVAREALNTDLNSILIPIFYALGYATGTYKVVDGLIGVSVITKSANNKMLKEMRDKGFGVSVVDLKKTNDNNKKDMLIIELNKKKLKELTHIIRTNDPDAFVVINETKYVQNGLIK